MVNITYNSTEDVIKKLQSLRGQTKLKFLKNISNFYDEMNARRQSGLFQFEEDPFGEDVRGNGNIYHEALLSLEFSQTKPQVENINIK